MILAAVHEGTTEMLHPEDIHDLLEAWFGDLHRWWSDVLALLTWRHPTS